MKKLIRFLLKLTLTLLIFPWFYAFLLTVVNPPITITQISNFSKGYSLNYNSVSKEDIPEFAYWAVVGSEDQNFAMHGGFDWDGIQKAMEENQSGKRLRGGSTLSQQVAKNVFLWQGRTWLRKALETYCTFVVETVLSKKRILTIYLNIAEMGKGVYGLEAAAEYYYNTRAKQLTDSQIATIIAALPNPKKYAVNPPSSYMNKRAKWIQRQVRNLKGNPDLEEIILD